VTIERSHGEYLISTDPTLLDLDLMRRWLAEESYWAKGRTLDTVELAVAHSLNFGAYAPSGEMVGGARVVTDFATFAWLCDVFVVESHRGTGLGKALVATAVEHPRLKDIKRFALATADAQGLYRQYGFEDLDHPERWMVRRGPTA
jgi:GNAT superfamily N-acetyltransferase